MAKVGSFDAEIRALSWFDSAAVVEGWFDYGMPFDHALIPEEPVTAATIPIYLKQYRSRNT